MREKLYAAYSRWTRWIHRYINGVRGAVSIFLVICMVPLLSIALLLVESARYQSASELLQEILDSAGLSTLAGYDSYLEERFGLLALSQDEDMEDLGTTMDSYIELNNNALGNSATVDSVSATGAFALSDVDIFERQILEYCEVSAPVKNAVEALNVSEIIKNLKKEILGKDGAEQLNNIETMASSTASTSDAITDLLDALVTLKDDAADYQEALEEYQTKYSAFEEKVWDLVVAIADAKEAAESEDSDDSDTSNIYDTDAVQDALDEVEDARKEYKTAASTLKSKFSTYAGTITSTWSKIQSASNSISKMNSTGTSEDETVHSQTVDWTSRIVNDILAEFKALYGDDYEDRANDIKSDLTEQIALLSNSFDETLVASFQSDSELVNWMKEYGYYAEDTSFTANNLDVVSQLETLATTVAAGAAMSSDESLGLSSYISLAKNLAGLSGIYDGSLNALVSSSYNYGAELYAELVTDSINDILDAGQSLIDADKELLGITGFKNIISALKNVVKAVYKLVKGLAELIAGIVTFLTDIVAQVAELIELIANGEFGRYYLLAAYSTYNMPNRTSATSGSSLSGYSYSKIAALNGGISSSSLVGSLMDYVKGESVTTDKATFYGAELEYLMAGTNDEIGNQAAVFMALYMERFVFNIYTIFKDCEVKLQAALAGPAAWVVYAVLLIFEPLIDTLLLVNGKNLYLVKDYVYLTPTGVYKLLEDLNDCASVTTQQKNQLKNSIQTFAETKFTDFAKWNYGGHYTMKYEEHCMVLLMLTVDKDTLLKRLQNIVQMESAATSTFSLSQAYTAVYADVTFTLNPMLSLDTLTESGLFQFHQTGYFSY